MVWAKIRRFVHAIWLTHVYFDFQHDRKKLEEAVEGYEFLTFFFQTQRLGFQRNTLYNLFDSITLIYSLISSRRTTFCCRCVEYATGQQKSNMPQFTRSDKIIYVVAMRRNCTNKYYRRLSVHFVVTITKSAYMMLRTQWHDYSLESRSSVAEDLFV